MFKKTILLFIILLSLVSINSTFAETEETWKIKVKISSDFSAILPGQCDKSGEWKSSYYYCNVPKWINWFNIIMAWLIKYITFIASIAWVLFIVINWILYSMWWADDSLKTESKKRIIQTLIWIILLLMSWIILRIIAPRVYQ